MQRILDEAAADLANSVSHNPPVDASALQQVSVNLSEENGESKNTNHLSSSVVVSKLQLRQKHILEDVDEVKALLLAVKLAEDMTDSEVRENQEPGCIREESSWIIYVRAHSLLCGRQT